MEYLCKCQGANSIGISKRGSRITTSYRFESSIVVRSSVLLAKSRDLCFRKMKSRIATNEECSFCGCTFAVSFIRETEFQRPTLEAICDGFSGTTSPRRSTCIEAFMLPIFASAEFMLHSL